MAAGALGLNTTTLPRTDLDVLMWDYQSTGDNAALKGLLERISPTYEVASRSGTVILPGQNGLLRGYGPNAALRPKGLRDAAAESDTTFATVNYDVERFAWGKEKISLTEIAQTAAHGQDAEATWVAQHASQGLVLLAYKIAEQLTTAGNYTGLTGTGMKLGLASHSVLQEVRLRKELLAEKNVNVEEGMALVMGPASRNLMLQLNEVQDTTAIGWAASGTNQVRTGSVDPSALAGWVKARLGCDLIVIPSYYESAPGTSTAILVDKVALIKVSAVASFLRTIVVKGQSAYGEIHSYETHDPEGRGLYIDSNFDVVCPGADVGGYLWTSANATS